MKQLFNKLAIRVFYWLAKHYPEEVMKDYSALKLPIVEDFIKKDESCVKLNLPSIDTWVTHTTLYPPCTTSDWVKELLYSFPATQNNKNLLIIYYWHLVDRVDFTKPAQFTVDFIQKATSAETIGRVARQVLKNNQDLYPTTKIDSDKGR